MTSLTHLNKEGEAQMVNVGGKAVTQRLAVAEGFITMPEELIMELAHLKKGNAFEVARLAGIMAAKKAADLIPLCHPLGLDHVGLHFETQSQRVRVVAEAHCQGKTGVEMEAMTAVSVALLTLYDMGKAVARDMALGPIRLLEKKGGKSGHWQARDSG